MAEELFEEKNTCYSLNKYWMKNTEVLLQLQKVYLDECSKLSHDLNSINDPTFRAELL